MKRGRAAGARRALTARWTGGTGRRAARKPSGGRDLAPRRASLCEDFPKPSCRLLHERPGAGGGRVKVLVIEDDEDVRDLVRIVLREEGHAVDTAADATDGLLLARTTEYDGIVLDVRLPDGNG